MLRNIRINIVLIFIIVFFIACTNYTDKDLIKKYGVEYNSDREQLGLEPIPNNFLIGDCTRNGDIYKINYLIDSTYFDKNKILIMSKIIKPRFIMKTVIVIKNQIRIKEDWYIHPKCINTLFLDGTRGKSNYVLSFRYFFSYYDGVNKGWEYIKQFETRGGIAKSEADSILHSWGLNRPKER